MPVTTPIIRDPSIRAAYSSAAADGRLSIADVKTLVTAATDGSRVTITERQDLATIASRHMLSPTAAKIWADAFGPAPVVPTQPVPEVRRGVSVTPLESISRWEGYQHTTPAPHWVFEQWSYRSVPTRSPTVYDVKQGDKRFLEFTGGTDSPNAARLDITNLSPGTRYLASNAAGAWSVKIEAQAGGLPYRLTLTCEKPGGTTGPNSYKHLGTTTTWSMFLS